MTALVLYTKSMAHVLNKGKTCSAQMSNHLVRNWTFGEFLEISKMGNLQVYEKALPEWWWLSFRGWAHPMKVDSGPKRGQKIMDVSHSFRGEPAPIKQWFPGPPTRINHKQTISAIITPAYLKKAIVIIDETMLISMKSQWLVSKMNLYTQLMKSLGGCFPYQRSSL